MTNCPNFRNWKVSNYSLRSWFRILCPQKQEWYRCVWIFKHLWTWVCDHSCDHSARGHRTWWGNKLRWNTPEGGQERGDCHYHFKSNHIDTRGSGSKLSAIWDRHDDSHTPDSRFAHTFIIAATWKIQNTPRRDQISATSKLHQKQDCVWWQTYNRQSIPRIQPQV